jgi:hypothetical protein
MRGGSRGSRSVSRSAPTGATSRRSSGRRSRGSSGESAERAASDLETYFEVRTAGAVRVAIGFGLTRDPAEDVVGTLTLDDLGSVELEACVDVAAGVLGVPAFSRIAVGTTIALATPLGSPGTFRVGDVPFARVTCGHAGGRNAAVFDGPEGGA